MRVPAIRRRRTATERETTAPSRALSGNGESTWAADSGLMGRTDVVEPPLTDLSIPDLARWAERVHAHDAWGDRYLIAKRAWKTR
jgi:hypothetical protein